MNSRNNQSLNQLIKKTVQLTLDFSTDTPFFQADFNNIKETLPILFEEQQNDVLLAEKRFLEGKGILFTNGTGTGKTFVGLGIAKRFLLKNPKANIMIVVPTDRKVKDWIIEANLFEMNPKQLNNIYDYAKGVSVTTYSNFYQNEKILIQDYDLIVYDEAHYLLQNEKGEFTQALYKHKKIAKLPSYFDTKFYTDIREITDNQDEFEKIYNRMMIDFVEKTKVVFLSATPFAYHKSLMLGDGCLWEIDEIAKFTKDTFNGYNEEGNYERFFSQNFGYTMRYNRLTRPDAEIDINLLERNFYENYAEKGIISGRQIKVDKDYSRDFVILNSTIGDKIDEGISFVNSKEFRELYPTLSQFANRKYRFQYINQLLECIKAKESIPRIKKHLALGRKVILFHNYNNSFPEHPFKFFPYELLKSEDEKFKNNYSLREDIKNFELDNPELINLDLSELANALNTITAEFPEAIQFNGKIPKKKRSKMFDEFNTSKDVNIALIQTKAGKEGISAHDKIGDAQRVLIVLGLPTVPTDAIQIEGRTYRVGLKSDAIFEYLTLQTNFERFAFSEKIAVRSRTAENLAMGNKARNLETIFKEGYLNATEFEPNYNQGIGGKESDYTFNEISEFEKTITYFYANGKTTAKNKSRQGADYYATPEPLGYKMVQWLDLKGGDSALEPSAGHGAIARFFPENTNNVFIEPSYQLASKLSLNAKGEILKSTFENYNTWHKFEGIAMNPPFGKSGKTAMEHIEKATKQLRLNGKLVAIVPNGSSMQKRLNAFFDNEDNKLFQLQSEIILPNCTFENAGTKVYCKVIIITKSENECYNNTIDLSYITSNKQLFEHLEFLEVA